MIRKFLQSIYCVRCIILRDKNQRLELFLDSYYYKKNEEHVLERTLTSLEGITDDLVIVDSGSTDGTLDIAKKYKAKILQTGWLGYGPTKNLGNSAAKYDWILSLDADEGIDETLKQALLNPALYNDPYILYDLSFISFIGEKEMRYGQWLNNHHIRLFNKNNIAWNTSLVHEKLDILHGHKVKNLRGHVLHYTMANFSEFVIKINKYALLNAEKYFISGKKNTGYKLYFTPLFTFLLNYIFRLGFLDGWQGFVSAKLSAHYSFLKYTYLKEMKCTAKNKDDRFYK